MSLTDTYMESFSSNDSFGQDGFTDNFFESEDEGDPFLGNLVGTIGSALGGLLGGQGELEGYGESELFNDSFYEAQPSEGRQASVLMEAMVDQLAEAEGEQEADQFLPILAALAPLAMKDLPPIGRVVAPALRKAVPQIARGVVRVGRQLARQPETRQLVRALPTITRNAVADIAQTARRTGQVNQGTVARAIARQTTNILQTPEMRRRVIQRNRRLCERVYGIRRYS